MPTVTVLTRRYTREATSPDVRVSVEKVLRYSSQNTTSENFLMPVVYSMRVGHREPSQPDSTRLISMLFTGVSNRPPLTVTGGKLRSICRNVSEYISGGITGNLSISVSIALAEATSNKKKEVKTAMRCRIALGIPQTVPELFRKPVPGISVAFSFDGNFLRPVTRVHGAANDGARAPAMVRNETVMRAF